MANVRRVYQRRSVDLAVEIDAGDDTSFKAKLADVSRGGAQIITSRELEEGSVVSIHAGSVLTVKGRVEHCSPGSHGRFQLGISFLPKEEQEGHLLWEWRLPGPDASIPFEYYQRLKRVESYIEENLDSDIRLKEAADIAALEKTYFCHYFRKKVGLTFGQFVQRQRLERCIRMMLDSEKTITEVCFEAGFGDLRNFERTFRKWTDLTPSAFRSLVVP